MLITNGGLQGLSLLAKRYARGNNVVVEWPTYDRALKVLLASGASLLAAVVDEEGLNTYDLEQQLMGQSKPAFVYTIPTFQNPTGRTLPANRRQHMVEVLGRRDIMIVEDDPYALIRFEGEPLPAVFDYAGKHTIYMSSFSKTIAPGLRVGFMILPESMAEDLAEEAASTYITPSLLSQAIVHEFIARGSFEPNLRRMNELLKARRDAMLAALDKHMSGRDVDAARGRLLRLDPGADGHQPGRGARACEGRHGRARHRVQRGRELPAPRLQLRVARGDRGRRRAARRRDVAPRIRL